MLNRFFEKSEWILPGAMFALAALLHTPAPAEAMDAEPGTDDSGALSDNPQTRLIEQLSQAINKQYPGASITVEPKIHWTHGALNEGFQSVALLGETSRGEMMFSIAGADGRRDGEGWASFSAWVPARMAVKRIYPGEKIVPEMFRQQNVNIATGQPHELRGVILEPERSIADLEARQTVLEGQMLLSTSVQHIPDVRRGDAVMVQLISNGLSLSTQGVAEEPAFRGGPIRVTASKTKRELLGKLLNSGVVEVKL